MNNLIPKIVNKKMVLNHFKDDEDQAKNQYEIDQRLYVDLLDIFLLSSNGGNIFLDSKGG